MVSFVTCKLREQSILQMPNQANVSLKIYMLGNNISLSPWVQGEMLLESTGSQKSRWSEKKLLKKHTTSVEANVAQ